MSNESNLHQPSRDQKKHICFGTNHIYAKMSQHHIPLGDHLEREVSMYYGYL